MKKNLKDTHGFLRNKRHLYFQKNFKLDLDFERLKKFQKFKTIVIIGMGGSILGAKAIKNFFEDQIKKKFIFLDNLDYIKINNLKINHNLKQMLFLVISKSGNTLETLSILKILKRKNLSQKNTIIITEPKDNFLKKFIVQNKIYKIDHRKEIGGRFSVLTEVGMLPAYFMNLKIKKFYEDVNKKLNFKKGGFKNTLNFLKKAYERKKYSSIILINYSPRLKHFLYWCQQLFSESLGKNKLGLLPVVSNAPKDHHSLLQLYLDGPKDKIFYFFFENLNKNSFASNKKKSSQKKVYKEITRIVNSQKDAFKSVLKKKNIPFREFEVKRFDEKTLGNLFSYFMIETSTLGSLLKINPFNQPAVEQVKVKTKQILSK